jgi:hypothetical protein
MKRIITAALAAAAIVGLSGCAAAKTDQAAAAPETKPAAAACETPSKALLTTIGSVLDSGVKPGRAAAVRSSEFEKAWFVAVKLKGESMADSDPAVFVTNDLEGPGTMYAVGGMSHEFSDLGHGEDTDAKFAQTSAGYAEAIACTKAAS